MARSQHRTPPQVTCPHCETVQTYTGVTDQRVTCSHCMVDFWPRRPSNMQPVQLASPVEGVIHY